MTRALRGAKRSTSFAVALLVAVPAVVAPAASAARAEPRKVSLSEATALALAHHPDLAMAGSEERRALASRKEATAHMGPSLKVEGSILVWDSKVTLDLGGGGTTFDPKLIAMLPPPTTAYEMATLGLLEGLSASFGTPSTVRERVTGSFSVTLVQPLTPLLAMYEGRKAADLALTVAKLQSEQKRREVALGVIRAYYDALRAAEMSELVAKALGQLEAHVSRARTFHAAGLIDRSSLLAAEVALAGAQGAAVSARTGVALARAVLAVAMGLSPSEVIVPVDDLATVVPAAPESMSAEAALAAAPVAFDIEEAERRALASRPELAALEATVGMAEAGARAATSALLPTLAVVGSYTHSEGNTFSRPDSFFGGATLSWDAWDWGAKVHAREAAKARVVAARAGIGKVRALLALDVRAAYLRVQASSETLKSATVAVAAADESFRIETTRFAANANTSTDVLDAEGRVTKAHSDVTVARFDYLLALAALKVAMGEVPGGGASSGDSK